MKNETPIQGHYDTSSVFVAVIGRPNVGKSTFINHLRGAAVAKTSDRPGVTRSNQWVKITPYLELLDTPGMLWPKLEDQGSARVLAFLGSIRDQIMDGEELATQLKEQYTIIIVTHNMQQAARISDSVAFFLLGELVEHAPTAQLFKNPTDPRTADYLTGRFG